MSKLIQKGMYVRCPLDNEYPENPRYFVMGQVVSIDYLFEKVEVVFYDFYNIFNYYSDYIPKQKEFWLKDVEHVKILENSKIQLFNGDYGEILSFIKQDNDGYFEYYIKLNNGQIIKCLEKELRAPLNRSNPDPIMQFYKKEFQNPMWFLKRLVVNDFKHSLNNSPFGFSTLIGSRNLLFSHQIDTILRGIQEDPCRLILADEVGLGKTIESIVIMEGLSKKNKVFNTMVLVPYSLVDQWQNEFKIKFWKDVFIYDDDFDLISLLKVDDKISKILIIPIEKLKDANILIDILKWDLAIIDEAHKYLKNEDIFNTIYEISKKIRNILVMTATPIQDRKSEYLNLLKLLDHKKYDDMTEEEFNILYNKSKKIQDIVYRLVKNLDKYIEEELQDEYEEDIEYLSKILNDSILDKLISQINYNSEDLGLNGIKAVLAYISQYYQFEKKIIRHRRAELKELLPNRTVKFIPYKMADFNLKFYELETYESVLKYIEYLKNDDAISKYNKKIYICNLLMAVLSSPWALEEVLLNRKMKFTLNENELDLINQIKFYSDLWKNAIEQELDNAQYYLDDPDMIKGRVLKVIDYINEEYDKKFVVFSNFTETSKMLIKYFKKFFGEDEVAYFYKGCSKQILNSQVEKFQNYSKCRIMICDESGCEGRNLQSSDSLIHFDMPISPILIEQRIGRLDRIGREKQKNVESIVIYAQDTIEEEFIKLWNEGLDVFRQSLSGLEIALDDLNESITDVLLNNHVNISDLLDGFKTQLNYIKQQVDKERYFDLARQLDKNVQEQIKKLIDNFDENRGRLLANAMLSWASMCGFGFDDNFNNVISFYPTNIKINSMKQSLFVLKNEVVKKQNNYIKGTFSRKLAVEKENLVFFAPGEAIFDSIIDNAIENSRGRCTAIKINGPENVEGLFFTFNIKFNSNYLYKSGFSDLNISKAMGYLPLNPICLWKPFKKDSRLKDTDIKRILMSLTKKDFIHLGKRKTNLEEVRYFNNVILPKLFEEINLNIIFKNAALKAKENALKLIDLNKAKNDFENYIIADKVSKFYFTLSDKEREKIEIDNSKLEKIYDCVLKGLRDPIIELSSIAFIWMVNPNE